MELTLQGAFNIGVAFLIFVIYFCDHIDNTLSRVHKLETEHADAKWKLQVITAIARETATTDQQKLSLAMVDGFVKRNNWGDGWYVTACDKLSNKQLLEFAALCERENKRLATPEAAR